MVARVGGSFGRGGAGREGCCHPRGGDGRSWPVNAGAARGLGGALLGGWAEPAILSCSSSATHSGGYLATPPTFTSCGLRAAHSCPNIPFNACGHLLAGLGYFCSFLATCGCPCGHLTPSQACSTLGQAEPPVGGLAKWP